MCFLSLHHSPSKLTRCSVFSLSPPTPSPSLSLPPLIPSQTPSPVSDHPCPVLEYSLYQVSPGHSPSRIPLHNPKQYQTHPAASPPHFPKNQPVASTRPPVQVLHAAFRPDSVLLPLLASLVLPWHAAQRTHSFLLYIILPGTRQPTRASYYKLTDANCSASAGVRVRRVCECVCVRVACES